VVPNGRWTTYLVRLNDIALPKGAKIRRIRITRFLSGGFAEIRSIRVLGGRIDW
jgi:hypothetical protein